MSKLTLISCSSCDLKQNDIVSQAVLFDTVPLTITISGKDWLDTEQLDTKQLVAAMKTNTTKPLTACPSPEDFAEKFRAAPGDVICMTISGKLSGTNNSAQLAKKMLEDEGVVKNIHIIDSRTASAGQTLLVHQIVALAESGIPFEQIVEKAEQHRDANKTRFLLQDLSNLVKTGRMSKVKGMIASALNIKLICGDDGNGEIQQYSKVIGTNKAINALSQFPLEKKAKDSLVVVNHAQNTVGLEQVRALLEGLGFTNIKTSLMRGLATFYANDQGIVLAY